MKFQITATKKLLNRWKIEPFEGTKNQGQSFLSKWHLSYFSENRQNFLLAVNDLTYFTLIFETISRKSIEAQFKESLEITMGDFLSDASVQEIIHGIDGFELMILSKFAYEDITLDEFEVARSFFSIYLKNRSASLPCSFGVALIGIAI